MTGAQWALIVAGTLFTLTALAGFLFSLALGLRTQRWWPLGAIVALWLFAMVAYSLYDGTQRRDLARERADSAGLATD